TCFAEKAAEERGNARGIALCQRIVKPLLPRMAGQLVGIGQPLSPLRTIVDLPPVRHLDIERLVEIRAGWGALVIRGGVHPSKPKACRRRRARSPPRAA